MKNHSDIVQIAGYVKSWKAISKCLEQADSIFSAEITFPVTCDFPMEISKDEKDPGYWVAAYLGYRDKKLCLILIQCSKDRLERYERDDAELAKDLKIIEAKELLISDPIEESEAMSRMDNWKKTDLRMQTMKECGYAPQIFMVPAEHFLIAGALNLHFGLKKSTSEKDKYAYYFDLLFEIEDENGVNYTGYYDTSRPVPPFKPRIEGFFELGLNMFADQI